MPCLTMPKAGEKTAKAFNRLTPRADDLIEIGALLKSRHHGFGRGYPSLARKLIAERLNQLNEIDVIKYRKPNQFGLKHLIRMVHPKPKSKKQNILFQYALSKSRIRNDFSSDYNDLIPQIYCFEKMIKESKNAEKLITLIKKGRLPWECVLPVTGSSKKIWKACTKSMPIMALLRNLRNLYNKGVLNDPEYRRWVIEKITSKDVVLNSKLLPFRWLSALKVMQEYDQEFADSLKKALEISVGNLPRLPGKTFISADNSVSMKGCPISKRSSLDPADIANLLGAIVYFLSEEGYASVFAEDFAMVPVSAKKSIFSNWKKMRETSVGHTTNAYKILNYLLVERHYADRIIILTDMIIYSSDSTNAEKTIFMDLLRAYRRQINPKVKTYIINLMPYEYFISPSDDLGVVTISGWSESILEYIKIDSLPEGQSMIDVIDRIEI
jgi:60 kDa SS-A/Ro ribonucleoprotein